MKKIVIGIIIAIVVIAIGVSAYFMLKSDSEGNRDEIQFNLKSLGFCSKSNKVYRPI